MTAGAQGKGRLTALRSGRFWLGAYTTVALLFLIYLPIVILIVFSFNDSTIMSLPWSGFTVRWYRQAFTRSDLLEALFNSFWVASVVTVASLVLGVLAANAMTRYRYRGRLLFSGYVAIPFVIPWLLLGIALLLFFNAVGIRLSILTVILSHIAFDTPLVAVIVAAQLHRLDPDLQHAARDLGCGPLGAFRHVTLPLIAPAVVAAAIFAFNWSFDAFVITHFVIGTQVTFPIWVWSALRFPKNLPIINAISSVIVLLEMVLIFFAERLRQRGLTGGPAPPG